MRSPRLASSARPLGVVRAILSRQGAHDPRPAAIELDEWERLVRSASGGPNVIGATGGSGTRVLARVCRRGGMFIGKKLNRSEDALEFAALYDRWLNPYVAGDLNEQERLAMTAEFRQVVAAHLAQRGAAGQSWGWKEPRSIYLLALLRSELPSLRLLHVVRDGRDMAYSANRMQLRKHGDAVLGESGDSDELRAIALWNDVNLQAADYGERELGDRYLRIRFEDLCSEPTATVARVLDFFGLPGDAEQIAGNEVEAPPTIGRWRSADRELVAVLEQRAASALERFGYDLAH
jgi:hypothetical protein